MDSKLYDIVVIGGGINGTAIACDAAGRGLSVFLCEKDDLASHTSSSSTKLIHGGLRYLEQYEFRLVRESLIEREVLLNKAPHIIWPLQFVMPHEKNIRPYWMIRLGLFLYDHLAKRKKLPASHGINFKNHITGKPLKANFTRGFIYSDCWVEDSRYVVLNAMQAQDHGASINTRCECVSANRNDDHWEVQLYDHNINESRKVRCKVLVNASGPWVDDVTINKLKSSHTKKVTLVKGSHIVVPKMFEHNFAYILQHTDKRVLFVIPYLDHFSLIGTTDMHYDNDPQNIEISTEEIDYLCEAVNRYFNRKISSNDVHWSYAGVRPLLCEESNNPSEISRDYMLDLDTDGAALLNVYGGKITTHRKLAEHALQMLQSTFPSMKKPWTAQTVLPGGDIENADFGKFVEQLQSSHQQLPNDLVFRYARLYGSRCLLILSDVKTTADLGTHFGANLYQKEIQYLQQNEFAKTADDVLWRRTKLGMQIDQIDVEKLKSELTS